jgi:hypothetical protein
LEAASSRGPSAGRQANETEAAGVRGDTGEVIKQNNRARFGGEIRHLSYNRADTNTARTGVTMMTDVGSREIRKDRHRHRPIWVIPKYVIPTGGSPRSQHVSRLHTHR